MSVQSPVVQTYHFLILATGSDPSATKHSVAVSFSTNFTFQIGNQSGVQSIAAGATASYDLALAPIGSAFPQSVSLACSGLPVESTCAFSPPAVAAGSGETPVTFTISTTAPVLARQKSSSRKLIFYCSLLPMLGVLLASAGRRRRGREGWISRGDVRPVGPALSQSKGPALSLSKGQASNASARETKITLTLLLLIVIGEIACSGASTGGNSGGNGTAGTSPGTYTITVTATMGSMVNSVPIQLTVN
jgi:hypothetical protein